MWNVLDNPMRGQFNISVQGDLKTVLKNIKLRIKKEPEILFNFLAYLGK